MRKLDHYILRALEARKDAGRSVVIFGADSAQSDGTIKGGAKAFSTTSMTTTRCMG
ncbi:hypothetical protein [Aeromonas veronii]|uniref:hypothetical protein n=1 Tax=Aeromonas veronii TaxID=654 RepID=UPI001F0A1798|nr:hypothetical protein [Aeromonas veronii]